VGRRSQRFRGWERIVLKGTRDSSTERLKLSNRYVLREKGIHLKGNQYKVIQPRRRQARREGKRDLAVGGGVEVWGRGKIFKERKRQDLERKKRLKGKPCRREKNKRKIMPNRGGGPSGAHGGRMLARKESAMGKQQIVTREGHRKGRLGSI